MYAFVGTIKTRQNCRCHCLLSLKITPKFELGSTLGTQSIILIRLIFIDSIPKRNAHQRFVISIGLRNNGKQCHSPQKNTFCKFRDDPLAHGY